MLRSYRAEEWPLWFAVAGAPCPKIQGPIFDSSVGMAEAAARGVGVGLVPIAMFENELASGRLKRPFAAEVPAGSYWLTWLKSRVVTPGMRAFRDWLLDTLRAEVDESENGASAPRPKARGKAKRKPVKPASKKRRR